MRQFLDLDVTSEEFLQVGSVVGCNLTLSVLVNVECGGGQFEAKSLPNLVLGGLLRST